MATAAVTAKVVATTSLSSMLTEAKTFEAYAKKAFAGVETIATKYPDLEVQAGKLVSGLTSAYSDAKSLNVTATVQDAHNVVAAGIAIYNDLGLPQDLVSKVASEAPTLPSVSGIEAAFSSFGKLFGV